MNVLPLPQALKRRRILRISMLAGFVIFMIATWLMATGHYDSYLERRAADAIYSKVAIGGLLYVAMSWIFCVLSKPFWFPQKSVENS